MIALALISVPRPWNIPVAQIPALERLLYLSNGSPIRKNSGCGSPSWVALKRVLSRHPSKGGGERPSLFSLVALSASEVDFSGLGRNHEHFQHAPTRSTVAGCDSNIPRYNAIQ